MFDNTPSVSFVKTESLGKSKQRMLRSAGRGFCTADLRPLVSEVYVSLFRRLPEDQFVFNPTVNAEFISRCRAIGISVPEFELNKELMNARKSRRHVGMNRESAQKLSSEIMERIGYASEIAARIVTGRRTQETGAKTSIDRMLCDPSLRREFDELVATLAPGAAAYECRLAALSYRKAGRRVPASYQGLGLPPRYFRAPLAHLDPMDVPSEQGIYRVVAGRFPVFVSATRDLRERMRNHLVIGNGQLVPSDSGVLFAACLTAEIYPAPREWRPGLTQAVAHHTKTEQRPSLNYFADAG